MRTEKIEVNGKEYTVSIITEQRSSSRVSLGKKGVVIRLPQGMDREEMFRETFRMKKWAMDILKERINKPAGPHKRSRIYVHGDIFLLQVKITRSCSRSQISRAVPCE